MPRLVHIASLQAQVAVGTTKSLGWTWVIITV